MQLMKNIMYRDILVLIRLKNNLYNDSTLPCQDDVEIHLN